MICMARPRVDLTRLFHQSEVFKCFRPRELRALDRIFSVVGACITASSVTLVRSSCDTRPRGKFFTVGSLRHCRDLRALVLQDIVTDLEQLVQLTDLTILFNDRGHHGGLFKPSRKLGNYTYVLARGICHLKQLERLKIVIQNQEYRWPSDDSNDGNAIRVRRIPDVGQASESIQPLNLSDGRKLADAISMCFRLTEFTLELTGMQLEDRVGAAIGAAMGMLTRLRKLSINLMNNKSIGVLTCQSLAESLSCMQHLEHLDLDLSENRYLEGPWNNRQLNGMTDDCIFCLAKSLQKLRWLVHLSLMLDETVISETSTSLVGNCLAHLNNMRHLQYRVPIESEIGLPHMSNFADGLCCLSKLKSLDLNFFACHLGDEVLANFSSSFLHVQSLTSLTLNLWDSGIRHEGISALLQSISYLHQLSSVVLDISRNKLGAEGGLAVASQVRWPDSLKRIEIELGQCDIGWIAVQSLVRSFFPLSHMHHLALNLDDNGVGRCEWEPLSGLRADLLHRAKCVKISCVNHSWHTDNDDDDDWDDNEYEQFGFDYFDSSCG